MSTCRGGEASGDGGGGFYVVDDGAADISGEDGRPAPGAAVAAGGGFSSGGVGGGTHFKAVDTLATQPERTHDTLVFAIQSPQSVGAQSGCPTESQTLPFRKRKGTTSKPVSAQAPRAAALHAA